MASDSKNVHFWKLRCSGLHFDDSRVCVMSGIFYEHFEPIAPVT
jgi:hypothetical protein